MTLTRKDLRDTQERAIALASERVALLDAKAALTAEKAALTLRQRELEGDLPAKEETLVRLRDEAAKRAEAELLARVEEAYDTYKDSKHMTLADKASLEILARASMSAFDKSYPKIAGEKRRLMRGGAAPLAAPESSARPTLADTTRRLMIDRRMPFEAAQVEASRLLANAPAAPAPAGVRVHSDLTARTREFMRRGLSFEDAQVRASSQDPIPSPADIERAKRLIPPPAPPSEAALQELRNQQRAKYVESVRRDRAAEPYGTRFDGPRPNGGLGLPGIPYATPRGR